MKRQARSFATSSNLYLDGYEHVARVFKRTISNNRAPRFLVIAPTGRPIYFREDERIPEALQAGNVGFFTRDCPTNVIEDALIHHMQEQQKGKFA